MLGSRRDCSFDWECWCACFSQSFGKSATSASLLELLIRAVVEIELDAGLSGVTFRGTQCRDVCILMIDSWMADTGLNVHFWAEWMKQNLPNAAEIREPNVKGYSFQFDHCLNRAQISYISCILQCILFLTPGPYTVLAILYRINCNCLSGTVAQNEKSNCFSGRHRVATWRKQGKKWWCHM